MDKGDIGGRISAQQEEILPDPVVAERILHDFSQHVTQQKETSLLTKRPWYFALTKLSLLSLMFQSLGMKVALAAFVAVATVTGVVVISTQASHKQASVTPKVAEMPASPTPTVAVEINTEADIEAVTKDVDKSVDDLDKIEKDLNSLDVSLSTQDLDTAIKQLDDIK